MRIITNNQLLLVAGGDDGEDSVQVVEIRGQRMSVFDQIGYAFENWGTVNDMSNWRKLQLAYEAANETGKPVDVEISNPGATVGISEPIRIEIKEGDTKYKLTVEPADYLKKK